MLPKKVNISERLRCLPNVSARNSEHGAPSWGPLSLQARPVLFMLHLPSPALPPCYSGQLRGGGGGEGGKKQQEPQQYALQLT